MKKIITCVLAMMGLTTACGYQNYEDADVLGFAELIACPDVVLLDVRTAEEFAEGHIEGAMNIDQAQPRAPDGDPAAVYPRRHARSRALGRGPL